MLGRGSEIEGRLQFLFFVFWVRGVCVDALVWHRKSEEDKAL